MSLPHNDNYMCNAKQAVCSVQTSSALLCEEVCGAFHDASLHEDPMAGQEDHALPLPELADFISEPEALYHSEKLTGPLTAASSGLHTQAHSITSLHEADATDHSHGQSTVAADGVKLVDAAVQNATAAETAEEVHGPEGQQPQAASIGTQHATSKQLLCLWLCHIICARASALLTQLCPDVAVIRLGAHCW